MNDDLVKELRFWNGGHKSDEKMKRAADRIEKLEAALLEMLSKCTWQKREQWCGSMGCHCQIARKALNAK